jgi:hypothetical protein
MRERSRDALLSVVPSEARDFAATTKAVVVEGRSLHAALRALVGTTGDVGRMRIA